jgi:hypothetical protein
MGPIQYEDRSRILAGPDDLGTISQETAETMVAAVNGSGNDVVTGTSKESESRRSDPSVPEGEGQVTAHFACRYRRDPSTHTILAPQS